MVLPNNLISGMTAGTQAVAHQESLRFRVLERFVPSIMFAILLPLSPLGLEWLITGAVKQDNWLLTAAVFTASLMATSQALSLFLAYGAVAAGILIGYGITVAGGNPPSLLAHPEIATLLVSLVHAMERIYRHVVKGAPFLEFRI